jgi:hypothetical protein
MDVDDKATELEELERASALALQQKAAAALRFPDGVCANCQAVLPPSLHFCDADCRDDYERRKAAARRNGS